VQASSSLSRLNSEETNLLNPKDLLAMLSRSSGSDHLRFLAGRVPTSLGNQLALDGGVELAIGEKLSVQDLLKPLSGLSFPTEHLFDFQFVLTPMILGYEYDNINSQSYDRYKVAYSGVSTSLKQPPDVVSHRLVSFLEEKTPI